MSYEVDGKGNIKVFIFTVRGLYCSEETNFSMTRCFTDYAAGWDWARQEGNDWNASDKGNAFSVDYEYEWVEHSEDSLEKFYESHEEDGF